MALLEHVFTIFPARPGPAPIICGVRPCLAIICKVRPYMALLALCSKNLPLMQNRVQLQNPYRDRSARRHSTLVCKRPCMGSNPHGPFCIIPYFHQFRPAYWKSFPLHFPRPRPSFLFNPLLLCCSAFNIEVQRAAMSQPAFLCVKLRPASCVSASLPEGHFVEICRSSSRKHEDSARLFA